MKRELTERDQEQITRLVATGDRVGAISHYISSTEAGLTDAQNFVKALMAENAPSPEKMPARRKSNRAVSFFRPAGKG